MNWSSSSTDLFRIHSNYDSSKGEAIKTEAVNTWESFSQTNSAESHNQVAHIVLHK